ncbi:MAG TPA: NlpC/P60 family protein [Actinospica sp.]|jgi:cell wall-associated NlpC family hydrolase|nr:NlpC/P60 family protein [Actinospica sp.]
MARHRKVPHPAQSPESVLRRSIPAVSAGAAACAAFGLGPGIGHAAPAPGDPRQAAEQRISALYQHAEAATQAYDAEQERIARLQAAVDAANGQRSQERSTLSALLGGLGRLAAQQYRDPAYSSTLELLFATHPDDYLERAGLGERVAELDAQQIRTAQQAEHALDELTALGEQEMRQLQAARVQLAGQRDSIRSELGQAHAELDGLGAADRRAVSYVLARGGGESGDGFGTSVPAQAPPLGTLITAVTDAAVGRDQDPGRGFDAARAQKAVTAAYAELGKPYVWGAVGPGGFDCSGLMQHAWSEAGVSLPRTSQEQADAGPAVPLAEIRPGDLVIYFSGRTHVGMYVGDGLVIHAPRPGSQVQFAAVGAMPISKIVRPDVG